MSFRDDSDNLIESPVVAAIIMSIVIFLPAAIPAVEEVKMGATIGGAQATVKEASHQK